MKKLVKSAIRAALYASDQVDRVSDHVSGLAERGRKAIFFEEDHALGMFLCFAVGVGFGIGAGILLAPASGAETRKSISEKMQGAHNNVRDHLSKDLATNRSPES